MRDSSRIICCWDVPAFRANAFCDNPASLRNKASFRAISQASPAFSNRAANSFSSIDLPDIDQNLFFLPYRIPHYPITFPTPGYIPIRLWNLLGFAANTKNQYDLFPPLPPDHKKPPLRWVGDYFLTIFFVHHFAFCFRRFWAFLIGLSTMLLL